MSSTLVLAATPNTLDNTPLSTIEANLEDFFVRVPSSKVVKFVRIVDVDKQVPNMATKCLQLEPEQLHDIKCMQGHCMSGTTSKMLTSGFQWLVDRADIIECLCEGVVDDTSELFLRACTRAPTDPENKAEKKGYEYDQAILWRLNYETLKLLKVEVLSKDACPYPNIHKKHFVYEFFKKTKDVEIDGSAGGPNRTYLEKDYPRILDFSGSKPKTINATMASSKKAMDSKKNKEYEKTQMPTDKLLRGHFNLLNNVTGVKRGSAGEVLCFEVMNSNQVETTRLGDRTIIMITPTHNTMQADAPLEVADDDE